MRQLRSDQLLRRPSAVRFHCATLSAIMRVDFIAAWLSWSPGSSPAKPDRRMFLSPFGTSIASLERFSRLSRGRPLPPAIVNKSPCPLNRLLRPKPEQCGSSVSATTPTTLPRANASPSSTRSWATSAPPSHPTGFWSHVFSSAPGIPDSPNRCSTRGFSEAEQSVPLRHRHRQSIRRGRSRAPARHLPAASSRRSPQ